MTALNASAVLSLNTPRQQVSPQASRCSHHDAGLHAVPSTTLLQGQRECLICHGDAVYRLRHTKQGKLILTK